VSSLRNFEEGAFFVRKILFFSYLKNYSIPFFIFVSSPLKLSKVLFIIADLAIVQDKFLSFPFKFDKEIDFIFEELKSFFVFINNFKGVCN